MTHFCATHAHEVPLPQMLPLGSTSGSNFVSRVIIRLTEALGTRLMGYLLSELFTSTHACYPYQWAISWAMCECVNTQYMLRKQLHLRRYMLANLNGETAAKLKNWCVICADHSPPFGEHEFESCACTAINILGAILSWYIIKVQLSGNVSKSTMISSFFGLSVSGLRVRMRLSEKRP